ncbi:MAG: hypothetical protein ACQKHC_02115 [Candidatus Phytoplasma pruni]|uniref:hypothetical protein n=1 Tax=Milkweed yellows phytoplasma TaxID=208434 RepID=UPI000377BB59|nr:hypothetical protein [Milkweed yellows phytoplasma]
MLIVGVIFGIKHLKDNKDESSSTSLSSNATSKILNKKVPDKGLLICLSFFDQDKYTNALTENINFRQSIYHSLNRKDLEQTNDNFKLSSSPVLFTKVFSTIIMFIFLQKLFFLMKKMLKHIKTINYKMTVLMKKKL